MRNRIERERALSYIYKIKLEKRAGSFSKNILIKTFLKKITIEELSKFSRCIKKVKVEEIS